MDGEQFLHVAEKQGITAASVQHVRTALVHVADFYRGQKDVTFAHGYSVTQQSEAPKLSAHFKDESRQKPAPRGF
jgi:hypothetical protein